jgi:dTDP-4-dehydrorhamnose 3,5-epimerase
VPPGLAHGFVVMSESADFLYKTTNYYAPAFERCIAWNDPAIGVHWPQTLKSEDIKLSAKDQAGMSLQEALV